MSKELPKCRYRHIEGDTFKCLSSCIIVLIQDVDKACGSCNSSDKDCTELVMLASMNRKAMEGTKQNEEGPGTELIKIYEDRGVSGCSMCYELAAKMNEWGVEGCQQRKDEIVADIMPRAKEWAANGLFTRFAPDVLLERIIAHDIDMAIKEAEQK